MNADAPERLDELTPHQLIDEIRQISVQYAAEVPGSRRHWPESVRNRIMALARLGIAKKRIADLTGIPAATVFLWCKHLPRALRRKSGQFIELSRAVTPTVGLTAVTPTVRTDTPGTAPQAPPSPSSRSSALCLRTPTGFVFEGLSSMDDLPFIFTTS